MASPFRLGEGSRESNLGSRELRSSRWNTFVEILEYLIMRSALFLHALMMALACVHTSFAAASIDRTWLLDADRDGRADQLFLHFEAPVGNTDRGSSLPEWVHLTWSSASDTATLTSPVFLVGPDSATWSVKAGPLAPNATIGSGAGGTGALALRFQGGVEKSYAVQDSVAPILIKATGHPGFVMDTLFLTFSEPMDVQQGLSMSNTEGKNGETTGFLPWSSIPQVANDLKSLTATVDIVQLGFLADSVRLSYIGCGLYSKNGTRGGGGPWIPLVQPDRPPVDAAFFDRDSDGYVDHARLRFQSPLRSNPRLEFQLGSEIRKIDSTQGMTLSQDRREVLVDFRPNTFQNPSTSVWTDHCFMRSASDGIDFVYQFPCADSVSPKILKAELFPAQYRIGKMATVTSKGDTIWSYSVVHGQWDTIQIQLSEPIAIPTRFLHPEGHSRAGRPYPISSVMWHVDSVTFRFANPLDTADTLSLMAPGDTVWFSGICDLYGNCPEWVSARIAMPSGVAIHQNAQPAAMQEGELFDLQGRRWGRFQLGDPLPRGLRPGVYLWRSPREAYRLYLR